MTKRQPGRRCAVAASGKTGGELGTRGEHQVSARNEFPLEPGHRGVVDAVEGREIVTTVVDDSALVGAADRVDRGRQRQPQHRAPHTPAGAGIAQQPAEQVAIDAPRERVARQRHRARVDDQRTGGRGGQVAASWPTAQQSQQLTPETRQVGAVEAWAAQADRVDPHHPAPVGQPAHQVLGAARVAAPVLAEHHQVCARAVHSTVTDLARLRGWSTSVPRWVATW
jgi:hypothetical protein